jgi:hypothetical protein
MLGGLQKSKLRVLGERDTVEEFNYKGIERGRMFDFFPVRAMFVPSALNDAVQDILAILYSEFRLDTKTRDEIIRKRHAAGERLSDLAHEFGISPQRIYQIVRFK